ncbi:MAG: hypothetical protein ACO1OG_00090 [Devosia sp.]
MIGLRMTKLPRLAALAMLTAALAGCSMGSMFSPAAPSAQTTTLQTANPTAAELQAGTTAAMPAIAAECPPIRVRPEGATMANYGNGRRGDAASLNYQAVIENQSRNCTVSNGLITVRMGMVGRLLLGPAGSQSSVNVPVRFTVERDGVAMFSERYDIPVGLDPANPSQEFVKVVENVAVPYTGGENIIFWVGFDT